MKDSPGSVENAHSFVWLKSSLFIEWIADFTEIVKPTEDTTILNILDGQYNYVQKVKIIDIAAIHNHLSASFRAPSATSR